MRPAWSLGCLILMGIAGCNAPKDNNVTNEMTELSLSSEPAISSPSLDLDPAATMDQAQRVAFPNGLSYLYGSSENSGCNNLTATAKVKQYIPLDGQYGALISVVGFEGDDAPHVCAGFARIDIVDMSNPQDWTVVQQKELYANGFGAAPDLAPVVTRPGSPPELTLESGYTAQGYTAVSQEVFQLTPNGPKRIRQRSSCIQPDGREVSSGC